jgi:hypothetical protein
MNGKDKPKPCHRYPMDDTQVIQLIFRSAYITQSLGLEN